MGDLEKEVFDATKQLNDQSESKNADQLSKTLVKNLNLINKVKKEASSKSISIDENARFSIQSTNLKAQIEDFITKISKEDFVLLISISHDLIKLQEKSKDDKILDVLLNG